jgi:protease IV
MSLDADHIVDRRRMRRKLTVWRAVALGIAAIAVAWLAVSMNSSGRGLSAAAGPYVARVTVDGLIRTDRQRVEALERLGRSSFAKAVVVHINSPGGTTAGSEQLHDALQRLKAQKPIVVVVDGVAASGGYIVAMAADHIIAQSSALVGSIGVLFQYPHFGDLMKTVGVSVESIKSAPLKASPNPFEPTTPEARAAIESIVMDAYAWFRDLVRDNRKLAAAELDRVTDGRVFTGRQALELKLLDELGEEKEALAWLAKEKGIDAKLPIRNYKLESRFGDLPFLRVTAATVLEAVGLASLAQRIGDWGTVRAIERLNLDGLLALWHPSLN